MSTPVNISGTSPSQISKENLPNYCENIHKILFKKLTTDQMANFMNLNGIDEKISFIDHFLKEHKLFESLKYDIPFRNPKDFNQSMKHLIRGNEYLRRKENVKALEFYNKSIASARDNSKLQSIGYGNRSMAHYQLKMYRKCLRDIKLTELSKFYPNFFWTKLQKLKRSCNLIIQKKSISSDRQTYIDMITKLTHPSNSEIPFIAKSLQLKYFPKFGRSIVTNRNLNVGDIIAIDKPFATILEPKLRYQFCSNCLMETFSLLPCPDCTSAMFCSRKCLKIAYARYHKYECSIIDFLYKVFWIPHQLLVIRTVLQTIVIFKEIDKLIEFDEKTKEIDTNLFTIDFSTIGGDYDADNDSSNQLSDNDVNVNDYVLKITERSYYPIHAIQKHIIQQNPIGCSITGQAAVLTVILREFLIENTILKYQINTNDRKKFLANFLCRHFEISLRSYHDLYYQSPIFGTHLLEYDTFGAAVYPFTYYMNHSCAPNVTRVYDGAIATIVVLRPIKKGEQLFDCYGENFYTLSKTNRQRNLKAQYFFDCECEACEKNYPMKGNLQENPEIPKIKLFKMNSGKINFKRTIKNIKKNSRFLNEYSNDKNYPCKQLYSSEKRIEKYMETALEYVRCKVREI